MLDHSLFGRYVSLTPGVHNTAISIGIIYVLALLCRIVYRCKQIIVKGKLLKDHGCLHLAGMSFYAKDISRLLRCHVSQILRLRRIVPAVVCPRIIVASSCLREGFQMDEPDVINQDLDSKKEQMSHERHLDFKFQFCSLPGVRSIALVVLNKKVEEIRDFAFSIEDLLHSRRVAVNNQREITVNEEVIDYGNNPLNPQPIEKLQPLIQRESEKLLKDSNDNTIVEDSLTKAILLTAENFKNKNQDSLIFTKILPPTDCNSSHAYVKIPRKALKQKTFFLIVIPTNGVQPSPLSPWVTRYLGGMPAAETYAEVSELDIKITKTQNKFVDTYSLNLVDVLHFSKVKAAASDLVPSVYNAAFQRYVRSADYSDEVVSPSQENDSQTQTRFLESDALNILTISQRTLNRFSQFVQRLLRQHQSQYDQPVHESLFFEPRPVPPAPQQWKDLVRIQRDIRLFGFNCGEARECLICMSRGRDIVLIPCRHCPCCSNCLKCLRQEKCPICRTEFTAYIIFPIK